MMKRIIGLLLMMVTVVASLSMFVSCKDYDDDINDLRNQISSTSSDLNSLVDNKVNTVESEISSLQSQLSSLESAYKAADENLQKAIDDALENAKKYADDSAAAAEQAAKDYADIQAAQAQEAAIAAAKELIEEAVAELQSQLDAANKTLEEYGTSILGLIEADAQLQVGIDEAVALANAAQEAAETAQAAAEAAQDTANQALAAAQAAQQAADNAQSAADNAQSAADAAQSTADANSKSIEELQETVKGLQDEIDALKQVDEGLQSSINSLQSQINVLNVTVEAVVSQAAENKANIEKVYLYLKGLSDANAEAIEELNGKYDALEKLVNENQEAIEKELSEAVEQLQGEIASALAQAEAYALAIAYQAAGDLYDELLDGEFADIYGQLTDINGNIVDIEGLIADLTTDVSNLQIAIQAVEDAYKEAIEEVYEYVDEADAFLQGQIDDLNAAIEELRNSIEDLDVDKLEKRVTTLEEQISELEAEVEGIQAAIEELQEYTNGLDAAIVSLQNVVSGQAKQIDVIFEELANINKYLGVLGKRLTSLVFAPTTYVDGIEAIKFSTLSYTAWDPENLEADGPDEGGTVYSINNNMHLEEYLVSPSHLDINSIASLSYVCNDAQNISTRSVSEEAPIKVASYEYAENKEGVKTLQLKLEKADPDADFSNPGQEFQIVALKATIAQEYLLDSEIEEGEEVAVYSDWARLYEEHVTPYIHNAIEGEGVDANGKLIEGEGDSPEHFYSWTEIHTSASGKDTSRGTAENPMGSHIKAYSVMSVEYTKTVDLNELVLVCDKNGNTYDIDTYGFEYQFNLFDYYYSEGSERDPNAEISEADYFGIQEGGILYALPSVDEEGPASRLAIGKYAPVQAILVDKNNLDADSNPAIVDVRYFLIYFTDAEAFYDMDQLYADSLTYDCGDSYTITISADSIAARCETEDLPITYEELLASYGLKTPGLYKSHEDAKSVGTTDEDGNSTEAEPDKSLGEIALEVDASGEPTGNIIWSITPEVTQEDYDAGEKVINAWGVYQSTTLESNIIPFELTIVLTIPKMEMVAHHEMVYWDDEGNRWINPGLETDPVYGLGVGNYATTQIEAALLAGYTIDGAQPTTNAQLVKGANGVHFVFDGDKLDELAIETGTMDENGEHLWSISSGGYILYYNREYAATIGDHMVKLQESDAGSATSVASEAAKLLVGHWVPIKLVATWCEYDDVFDVFNMNIIPPLGFDTENAEVTMYDVTAGGSGSATSLDNTIRIRETFTTNKRVVWDNYVPTETNSTLVGWYAVKDPDYDLDNALTNITTNGDVVEGDPLVVCTVPLSSLTTVVNGQTVLKYRISYNPDTNEFIFKNNSGNYIKREIMIIVPVRIATKWQDDLEMKVIIHILPGDQYPGN